MSIGLRLYSRRRATSVRHGRRPLIRDAEKKKTKRKSISKHDKNELVLAHVTDVREQQADEHGGIGFDGDPNHSKRNATKKSWMNAYGNRDENDKLNTSST